MSEAPENREMVCAQDCWKRMRDMEERMTAKMELKMEQVETFQRQLSEFIVRADTEREIRKEADRDNNTRLMLVLTIIATLAAVAALPQIQHLFHATVEAWPQVWHSLSLDQMYAALCTRQISTGN